MAKQFNSVQEYREWWEQQKAKYKNKKPSKGSQTEESFTHQAYREQREDFERYEYSRQSFIQ